MSGAPREWLADDARAAPDAIFAVERERRPVPPGVEAALRTLEG